MHFILNILKRLHHWLKYLLALLILADFAKIAASSQTFSNLKFPLIFGFSSGETEIISMD